MSDHNITPRELDVLKLLNQHLQDKEIAKKLGLSRETVTTHVKAIRKKYFLFAK